MRRLQDSEENTRASVSCLGIIKPLLYTVTIGTQGQLTVVSMNMALSNLIYMTVNDFHISVQ